MSGVLNDRDRIITPSSPDNQELKVDIKKHRLNRSEY
jgi:hypothetical protein